MKYKIHVVIGDYEFIETEVDDVKEIRNEYRAIRKSLEEPKAENKVWNGILDKMMMEEKVIGTQWEELSDLQKYIINEIKKSFARIKSIK